MRITGEVYLEVARNVSKPFKVHVTPSPEIEVLGTAFNINAYSNEVSNKTTLIEGSVRIRHLEEELILKPGQQAIADQNLSLNKRANVQQVIAWKNGTFNFNGLDFATSMRQLERWYDIKVVYDGQIPKGTFLGEIDRKLNLSDAIELLNGVVARFKLEGRELHVLK